MYLKALRWWLPKGYLKKIQVRMPYLTIRQIRDVVEDRNKDKILVEKITTAAYEILNDNKRIKKIKQTSEFLVRKKIIKNRL